MNILRIAIIPVLMLLASGCATAPGYDRFFNAETNATVSSVDYSNVVVQLFKNDDEMKSVYWSARDNGALLLGQAAWEGPYTDPDQAKWRAAFVGANLVLVSICYSHTRTGTTSLPQYHPGSSTTYSTYSSGNVSGYGDTVHYSGNSTTTASSPGYTTYNYVPYSVARYDHWAVFLRTGGEAKVPVLKSNMLLPISEDDKLGIEELHREILADPSNPTNSNNHIIIGNAYMSYRHYPEAIVEYQAVLNMDPTNLYAMDRIGTAFLGQNKYDEAIKQFKRMLQLRSNSAWAHIGLARCYYHGKKDSTQAENHWFAVLDICADRKDQSANFLKAQSHWGLALVSYFDKKSPAVGSDHAYQAGKLFIDCSKKENSLEMIDLIKTCDPTSPLAARLTDYIYSKEENSPKSPSSDK